MNSATDTTGSRIRILLHLALLTVFASCAGVSGGTETREIDYESNGVSLKGFLALPSDTTTPRPGVLVVHEWWGHNDYVRGRAQQLADAGYVALALDMYGSGQVATHPEDAQEFMQEVMGNADVMEARFRAALKVLHSAESCDPERTAAIGYCMGGGIVLRMARATDTLDAVASFHGSLGAALDAGDDGGTQHYLIAHGGSDPFVSNDVATQLESQLTAMPATKSVKLCIYPDAKHGFTNPAATAKGEEFGLPLAYDSEADSGSWAELVRMLGEAFE